jgi:TolB protein
MKNYKFCIVTVLYFTAFLLLFFTSCVSAPTDMDVSITAASSNVQNIIRVTDNKFRKTSIAVSPDGKKLLYSEANEVDVGKTLFLEDFRVMLLRDVGNSAKTPLITDPSYGAVWFPDNSTFAYVAYEDSGSKIVRSTITGGGKTYITRTSAGESDANPNLKNGVILCDILVSGKRQLVSMKDNGTEITILGEGEQPSWHPSGTKFVFVRHYDERHGTTVYRPASIYEMDLKTNQVTQIYSATVDEKVNYVEVCSKPSYSADGKYVLFAKGVDVRLATVTRRADRRGQQGSPLGSTFSNATTNISERRLHLYLMNADGTGVQQLTSGNVDVFSPTWGVNNDIYFICLPT